MSEEKSKPVLDERTLDKLLEAAYVLQEHNDARRKLEESLERQRTRFEAETSSANLKEQTPAASGTGRFPASTDYTVTLGKIVETQRQIQVRQLDLQSAMSLVAERVVEITGATGSAIGLVEAETVRYLVAAGRNVPSTDDVVPSEKAISHSCIKTGQIFRCDDISHDTEIDKDECRRRGIQSLIAAPIFLQGGVAGALELYYAELGALTDQDVHTCQLMAGLISEALVRDEEVTWKKSLAWERAAMLEALEKLQPNLAALVEPTGKDGEGVDKRDGSSGGAICKQCGHQLLAAEQFCGECGTPRQAESVPVEAAETDVPAASEKNDAEPEALAMEAFALQRGQDLEFESQNPNEVTVDAHGAQLPTATPEGLSEEEIPDFAELLRSIHEKEAQQVVQESAEETESPAETTAAAEVSTPEEDKPSETKALQKLTRPADWSSAASAKDFLEQLAGKKGSGPLVYFWNERRGDIYLAISIVLVMCVIVWGVMSNHSTGVSSAATAAAHRKTPDVELSLWDRMLIQLGLAEAPEPPEDKGNPAVQVWIDTRTALYYCPGTDLYGKTPKGKFESQRDAQLDQFEPAYRKPCN